MARILIVEDEIIIAEDIRDKLIAKGFDVIDIVQNGESAIRKALSELPDLILMDVKLKGEIDGIAAALEIKRHKDISIIFLTSFSDGPTIERIQKTSGIFGLVLKPLRERELFVTIEMTLYRNRAERTLQENQRMLSTVMNSMSVCIIVLSPAGVIEVVNPVTTDLLGYTEEELVGKDADFVIDLSDMLMLKSWMKYLIRKETIRGLERRYKTFDGRVLTMLFSSSVIRDAKGEPEHIVCSASDISDRKIVESELLKAQRYAQSLINSSMDYIVAINKDGFVNEFNISAQLKFGYSFEEIYGQTYMVLFQDIEDAIMIYQETLKRGSFAKETRNMTKEGVTFPSSISISLLLDMNNDVNGMVCVIRDISESREMAQRQEQLIEELKEKNLDLKNSQERLVQSEKMASLGQLVAGVAHEINTPVGIAVTASSRLATITNELKDIFENNRMKKSDLQKYISESLTGNDMVLRNLRRASDLVRSFKMVSADQTSQETRRFNLLEYLNDVILSLRPRLKKAQHNISVICPEDIEIESNPGAISQVITNLIMNSLLHAYDEGQAGNISITCRISGEMVEIEYRDDGKGIPKENLGKIFDPFFTTRRGSGGTGLGLNIVYNIISQNLSGNVRCESEVGAGTAFFIDFPCRIL